MKIRELFETSAHYDTTEILEWWKDKRLISDNEVSANADGSITINTDDFIIVNNMLDADGTFPLKIVSQQKLTICAPKLTSFKNFPNTIICNHDKQFSLRLFNKDHPKLKTLEGCPEFLDGIVDLSNGSNLTLSGIHKHIKRIQTGLYVPFEYKGPLLSVLKIKELEWVGTLSSEDSAPELFKATELISNHLQRGRNILNCQEDLIDYGLEEYAQL